MINLNDIRKKHDVDSVTIGSRLLLTEKAWFDSFCERERVSLSRLIAELLRKFKNEQGD